MPKIEMGSIGAVLSPGDSAFVDTAVQLEEHRLVGSDT